MDYNDWKVKEYSVALLCPAATAVIDIESTKHVTYSLLLLSVYMLVQMACKDDVVCHSYNSVFRPAAATPQIPTACDHLRKAPEKRFINVLRNKVRERYIIVHSLLL